MRILLFFFKAFSVALVALLISWALEGSEYHYRWSRAQEPVSFELVTKTLEVKNSFHPLSLFLKDTNFLLLGRAGEPYPAPNLTDTIIVASFKADPLELTLTSLPRDFLVKVPKSEKFLRVNSLYELGLTFSPLDPEKFILDKVEEITGLSIGYVAVVDVIGLEKIIDSVGGVDIDVTKEIFDPFFPGPNYSYEPFSLEKGKHHLNGHDAVRFVRSRHSPRGDFDRIERQQQLLQALRETVRQKRPSISSFVELFSNLKNHLQGNITLKELPLLLRIFLLPDLPINNQVIEIGTNGLLDEIHTDQGAYALIPKAGREDYSEIRAFFQTMSKYSN